MTRYPEFTLAAKAGCDVGGHSSRPDILQLHLDGRPLMPPPLRPAV